MKVRLFFLKNYYLDILNLTPIEYENLVKVHDDLVKEENERQKEEEAERERKSRLERQRNEYAKLKDRR